MQVENLLPYLLAVSIQGREALNDLSFSIKRRFVPDERGMVVLS